MEVLRYNLVDFKQIIMGGFNVTLPDETITMINDLASQVGSPTYIRTPVFQKTETLMRDNNSRMGTGTSRDGGSSSSTYGIDKRRKKNGRATEIINDNDWETIRGFQPTKIIEEKSGIELQMDVIRGILNKMTDKNYCEKSNEIIEILNKLVDDGTTEEDMKRLGVVIFEIASNNIFYSKIYADLYSDLIHHYEIMKQVFENNLMTFMDLFVNVESADPEVDYNKFCKVNKDNERRKALSTFFVNLTRNQIISRDKLFSMAKDLLNIVLRLINEENKKTEVEQLVENISVLYNKDWFEEFSEVTMDGEENENFTQVLERIAKSKMKTYLSVSNKARFKCMDLVEI
jgi:hypothetical protein